MALDVTPVNRNLHTRVTFMALEFEDLFVVLGLAALIESFIATEVPSASATPYFSEIVTPETTPYTCR